jgi:hypothetical protein
MSNTLVKFHFMSQILTIVFISQYNNFICRLAENLLIIIYVQNDPSNAEKNNLLILSKFYEELFFNMQSKKGSYCNNKIFNVLRANLRDRLKKNSTACNCKNATLQS